MHDLAGTNNVLSFLCQTILLVIKQLCGSIFWIIVNSSTRVNVYVAKNTVKRYKQEKTDVGKKSLGV